MADADASGFHKRGVCLYFNGLGYLPHFHGDVDHGACIDFQRDAGLTYLCITHNLDVVGYLADSVCVLEAGRIVERGTVDEIFDSPQEAYTQRLLNAIPSRDPAMQTLLAQNQP